MDPLVGLALDQKELKECLAVMLTEKRQDYRQSLPDVAFKAGLPEALLAELEANKSIQDVDPDLMKALMKGYDLNVTEVNEVLKVACASRLVHVIRTFEGVLDD